MKEGIVRSSHQHARFTPYYLASSATRAQVYPHSSSVQLPCSVPFVSLADQPSQESSMLQAAVMKLPFLRMGWVVSLCYEVSISDSVGEHSL